MLLPIRLRGGFFLILGSVEGGEKGKNGVENCFSGTSVPVPFCDIMDGMIISR
jgi:hypothetical protein